MWVPAFSLALLLAAAPDEVATPAEASGYRATGSYHETMAFLERLQALSPFLHLSTFGTSAEGRPLPLVVVSREKAFTAAAARATGKPIVLVQNAVHAGEADGNDACAILLRDLVRGRHPEILERVVLLVAPIYNADGHARVSRYNRANQDGPEEGMGYRTTTSGLDLNRDNVKLASAEARALVALVNEWRPHLHVDDHVSDGHDLVWELGFQTAEAPQAPAGLDAWMRAHVPAVVAAAAQAGHPIGPYVELIDEEDPARGGTSAPYRPRYSTGYFALRNRASFLVETHSRKPFRTRVLANHAFLSGLLGEVAKDGAALVRAVEQAERRTAELGAADAPPSEIILAFAPDRDRPGGRAVEGPGDRLRVPFFAWRKEESLATGGELVRWQKGAVREVDLPWWHTPRPARVVSRPRGYLVLPGWPQVEERVLAQGLRVQRLAAPLELEVETMRVSEPAFAPATYQGQVQVLGMKVERRAEKRRVPAGALWIPADQPDFEVAAQLLEPDAPDSLVSWGYLSTIFERKEGIDPPELEDQARALLKDPQVAAEWQEALGDPAFAADRAARRLWWHRRTPFWDETVGLAPAFRVVSRASLDAVRAALARP